MRRLTGFLCALFLATAGVLGCDEAEKELPPADELDEAVHEMEEAKTETDDRPEGTPAEDNDTPIEGTPAEVLGEMNEEMDAYEERVKKAEADFDESLLERRARLAEQVDEMLAELDAATLATRPDALDPKLAERIATLKKEWNQTKRQIDLVAGPSQVGEE